MEDFIKSKSMMTPGMAGSATMMITGTLVSQFGLPGALTALGVSFFFGLVVWADRNVLFIHRLIFYVINSATIFSVAVGINQAGIVITKSEVSPQHIERSVPAPNEPKEKPFFQSWL